MTAGSLFGMVNFGGDNMKLIRQSVGNRLLLSSLSVVYKIGANLFKMSEIIWGTVGTQQHSWLLWYDNGKFYPKVAIPHLRLIYRVF